MWNSRTTSVSELNSFCKKSRDPNLAASKQDPRATQIGLQNFGVLFFGGSRTSGHVILKLFLQVWSSGQSADRGATTSTLRLNGLALHCNVTGLRFPMRITPWSTGVPNKTPHSAKKTLHPTTGCPEAIKPGTS